MVLFNDTGIDNPQEFSKELYLVQQVVVVDVILLHSDRNLLNFR